MNTAAKPDASLFSKDEKPGEYKARFRVEGEVTVTIKADSDDEAKAKAYALLEDDDFGLELDDISDIRIANVSKTPAMYRISRAGKKMQTSYLTAGDEPREPDERGF